MTSAKVKAVALIVAAAGLWAVTSRAAWGQEIPAVPDPVPVRLEARDGDPRP